MKKVAVFLFALMFGTSITVNAQGNNDPVNEVRQVLIEKMTLPENLKSSEMDEDVKVKLAVTPEGKVQVLEVETENTELSSYVSETIASLSIPENLVDDVLTFSVNILFKVI